MDEIEAGEDLEGGELLFVGEARGALGPVFTPRPHCPIGTSALRKGRLSALGPL